MSDVLTISSGAVTVYQRMLGTVSNNISNVGNANYVRQEGSVVEIPPTFDGRTYIGGGAIFNGVKRQYSAFIESSLRNATSNMVSQQSLVSYANRVLDIMGSGEAGLSPALDRFFASARALAADPAATISRISFLRDADGAAARFRDLAGQLAQLDTETQQALSGDIGKINTLARQIAQVNTELDKNNSLERQPAALLDQRDALLRDLSKLIDLKTVEADNGSMTVMVGGAGGSGALVSDQKTTTLAVQFESGAADSNKLVLDPYGTPQLISGTPGGSAGGLRSFRSQMLEPAMTQLDYLAKTFMNEVNQRHQLGVDAQGNTGKALFALQPQFTYQQDTNSGDVAATATLADSQAFDGKDIRLSFDAKAGQVDTVSLLGPFKAGDKIQVSLNGLSKTLTVNNDISDMGALAQTLATFIDSGIDLKNGQGVQGGFGVALRARVDDKGQILVNSSVLSRYQFKVSVSSSGTARAQVDESAGLWTYTDPQTRQTTTGSNTLRVKGLQIDLSGHPRDGQTVIVTSNNRPAGSMQMMVQDPGRVAAAAGFRATGDNANLSPLRTAVQELSYPDGFAPQQPAPILGSTERLQNNPVPAAAIDWNATRQDPLSVIAAGTREAAVYIDPLQSNANLQVFTREGVQLAGTKLADGSEFVSKSRIPRAFSDNSSYSVQYLNGAQSYRGLSVFYGLQAFPTTVNLLGPDHVPVGTKQVNASLSATKAPLFNAGNSGLELPDGALTLNGIPLTGLNGLTSAQAIASRINHIVAGDDSVPAAPPAQLVGVKAHTVAVKQPDGSSIDMLELTRDAASAVNDPQRRGGLQIGFGTGGSPKVLARLGLRTAAYIKAPEGQVIPEDLMVFASSSASQGNAPIKVAAEFSGTPLDVTARREALRNSPFAIKFLSSDHYQIVDQKTNTMLAERNVPGFKAGTPIDFGGLRITLNGVPAANDSYLIDGNKDGLGDNSTALKLAELEKAQVAGDANSLTLGEAYLNTVDKMAGITQQAQISTKALEVVQQQAKDARESVSGVSLDEEAANLIRFQQAYQASAKAMQVATEMFDAIVKI